MNLFTEIALTSEGWAKNVRVKLDKFGRIEKVESGTERDKSDQYLRNRILLPALSNLHSHSFQRALAGLAEKRLGKRDNFWDWRNLMYKFIECITPEKIEVIAALSFKEMLECGYASVGEFHYLHHQVGGQHYQDIAETSNRLIKAAKEVGIGLTLLPVFYFKGDLKDDINVVNQIRFVNDKEQFLSIFYNAKDSIRRAHIDYSIGMAPHSLRAVPIEILREIVEIDSSGQIHIHIAEQIKEVEIIQENFGARPVEWLLKNIDIDSRWCLIHATHMNQNETKKLAKSGAVVGLCPITEANLGDGIFDGRRFILSKGQFGIGTDSNVRISLTEELRLLEYSQRLLNRERSLMINNVGSVGDSLFNHALIGGAKALNRKSGSIAEGNWADLLTLDSDTIDFCDCGEEDILDRWIFSGDDKLVKEVWSAGRQMVVNGKHIHHEKIERQYKSLINEIRN